MYLFQKLLLCIFCIIFPLIIHAQSTKKFDEQYELGKQQLALEKYDLAQHTFKGILTPNRNNKHYLFAQYYYAFSNMKLQNFLEAYTVLTKLVNEHKNWKYEHEALYLLGDVSFQIQNDSIALLYLDRIKSKELNEQIINIQGYYLSKRSLENLKELYKNYPTNKVLAQILTDKIVIESYNQEDIELLEEIAKTHKLETPKDIQLLKKKKAWHKGDTLTIAAFFNFDIQKKTALRSATSQYALDMYQGMRFANKMLDSLGMKVNLIAYDIANIDTLAFLEKTGDFRYIDLAITPFEEEGIAKLSEIAQNGQINAVSPIVAEANMLKKYKNVLTFAPTLETQAKKIAEYASKTFSATSVIVLYGDTPRDSSLAYQHKVALEKLKVKNILLEKITLKNLYKLEEIFSKPEISNVNYLLVSASSQTLAIKLMQILKEKALSMPIFVPDSWLKFQSITMDQYEKQNTYFIAPEYIMPTEKLKAFNLSYKAKTKKQPSMYTYLGYEIMQFFGRNLYEQGPDFRKVIQKSEKILNGEIFYGINYYKSQDNQFVPLLKVKESKLEVANKL